MLRQDFGGAEAWRRVCLFDHATLVEDAFDLAPVDDEVGAMTRRLWPAWCQARTVCSRASGSVRAGWYTPRDNCG